MKIPFRFLALSLLLAAVQPLAHAAFEGKVTLAMTADRAGATNMDYSIKGQKVRMDMAAQGHQMVSITDMAKLETIMLMPSEKMYMVMSLKQSIEKAMKDQDVVNADIEVTGKTDTILGYKCNQILVKDKGTITEVWIAEGLGAFPGMGSGGNPMAGMMGGGKSPQAAKWETALKGKGEGFPLRVISKDKSGKQTFKMEATKIDQGALSDSLFVPPAGYTKFDMPDMGGLVKAFGGN